MSKRDNAYLLNYNSTRSSEQLNKLSESIWLISATLATIGSTPFTSSSISGHTEYGRMNSYREDLKIVNRQITGEKGVYASNLVVNIPRDSNSVQFFTTFCAKSVMSIVKIKELVDTESAPICRQEITYNTCMIEQYSNLMYSVELSINYESRSDKYVSFSNGSPQGNVVSSFSG